MIIEMPKNKARCDFFPSNSVGPKIREGPILWYYSRVLWCVRRRRADGPTLISNTGREIFIFSWTNGKGSQNR
jgi:hypothetical protein